MERFIPKEKMSKKARRQLERRQRLIWEVSPVTKVFRSKKQYSRKRKSYDNPEEWSRGIFFMKAE